MSLPEPRELVARLAQCEARLERLEEGERSSLIASLERSGDLGLVCSVFVAGVLLVVAGILHLIQALVSP